MFPCTAIATNPLLPLRVWGVGGGRGGRAPPKSQMGLDRAFVCLLFDCVFVCLLMLVCVRLLCARLCACLSVCLFVCVSVRVCL